VEPLSRASSTEEVVAWLKEMASEENRAGMARFGIETSTALGIGSAELRRMARSLKRDHARALDLWNSGIREARLLAAFTEEPDKVDIDQCRRWAGDFASWDIVDGVSDLFAETPFWLQLIDEFAADEREFVRRAAFAMLAWAAVHRRKEPDATFAERLPLIEAQAHDPRNFVKKAVNWALRQIGKRSLALHAPALALSRRLADSADRTARWIGRDALRELTNSKTMERLTAKAARR
jgi:3-methyladenine DNA glycosylase AlkD